MNNRDERDFGSRYCRPSKRQDQEQSDKKSSRKSNLNKKQNQGMEVGDEELVAPPNSPHRENSLSTSYSVSKGAAAFQVDSESFTVLSMAAAVISNGNRDSRMPPVYQVRDNAAPQLSPFQPQPAPSPSRF